MNSDPGGNGGQQNSQPQLVDQEDTQGNGQPQGRDRDGLHPPGDALVLLEVPDIRPQLRMRHQPGMQPRRPLHPAPRRQQQERSGRQHRQEHPRHSQSQRHGTQYDQQIIHDSNSRPKSNKNHLSASPRPYYPSSFPQRQQNPRFGAVAESAFPMYPLHRPLCGIFPPPPFSTTAAKPTFRCRCGSRFPHVPSLQPLYGIFPPFPFSTTAAKPLIRCRCGNCISREPSPQPLDGIFPPSPFSTTAAKPTFRCHCGGSHQSVKSRIVLSDGN